MSKQVVTITLAEIRKHKPCTNGWKKLIKSLGGIKKYGENTPITFQQIYKSNGHDDTLWCLRITNKEYHYLWRHFAVDAAMAVKHLMKDEHSKEALLVARKHADGEATDEQMDSAWDSAEAAARDAVGAARDAAWTAAWASVGAARDAAWAAAWAAWAAAGDAAWVTAAARAAARDVIQSAQMRLLFLYCDNGKRPENSENLINQFMQEGK